MGDGSLVSLETRDRLRGGATPFARAFGRAGLTPNALTVLGFLISVGAAALAGYQLWFAAGVISIAGALFDMLDGALARATGTTSQFGAFLDSTLDRWGEAAVYIGITAGAAFAAEPLTGILAAAAMSSAFMVSYSRAKAESLGFRGEVGIAPRPERIAILAAGLIAAGVVGGAAGLGWLRIALGAIFLLSSITTVQRILYVRNQARAPEAKP
jgi:CDP-diacylglycerol--glycerol-3-phosphate 3-phosphatidyltransferase